MRDLRNLEFIYWSDAARLGRQIAPYLDPRQIPSNLAYTGAAGNVIFPERRFESAAFWAQGVIAGIEVRY